MSSLVRNRIEPAPACDVINLSEAEKDLYTGSGWKLARFEHGVLKGFFDPARVPMRDSAEDALSEVLEAATAWIGNADGEVWLVMCSSYQLCDPIPVGLTDARGLARMARVFAEGI